MIIPQITTQFSMLQNGLELYIDLKGKKRESKGVEFPIRNQTLKSIDINTLQRNGAGTQEIVELTSLNLSSLKLLGFNNTDVEPLKQSILTDGSINIQNSWDSANVMYIEYTIPFKLLGESSITQKPINLGWKIKGAEFQTHTEAKTVTYTTVQVVGVPAGSRPPLGRNNSGSSSLGRNSNQQLPDSKSNEQSFWTKYTISVPAK